MDNQITPVEQKTVDFNGAELLAVKFNDGKVYAGARWICNGLGLNDNQRRGQYMKLNEDVVLSRGVKKISLPTNSGTQEALCIELEFLPLWLAKINAGIIDDLKIQDRVIEYQLKAKDVLAAVFLPTNQPVSQAEVTLQLAQCLVDQEKKIQALETNQEAQAETIQNIKEALAPTDKQWRKYINEQLNKVARARGDDFQGVREESYDLLEKRAACNLRRRLANHKERLFEAGASKTKINDTNRLDVIDQDRRLQEIYTAIVRELAIKYVA
ncbi:MAG: hypothetical protein GXY34_00340 [Syntrophomonadaceae bacterium]|nr:hypothetical protein [Syntrophomonadaceae bacterium]